MIMLVVNPHPSGEQLHEDFAVVSGSQMSAARIEAAEALLARSGSLTDALTYYHGADPAHEVDNAYFSGLSEVDQQLEMYGRVIISLHAAEILVASVVDPGLYDRRDSKKVRMLSKHAEWFKILSPDKEQEVTPYDTIGESLDKIRERELSTVDASTLSMSSEMLSSALTWWQIAGIKMYKSNKEGFIKDDRLRTVYRDSEIAMASSVIAVQEMVKLKMLGEKPLVDIEPREVLERATLGLKAQWRTGAIMMNPTFRHAAPEQVSETLMDLVNSLQSEFIDNDLLDTKKYPKHVVKGLLHELLWLVDAHMVMLSNPDEYRTIQVGISSARMDRPQIGRPVYSRGIDFAIADVDTGGETHLINLKSGHGDDREYHPRVKVIKEGNFQDVNRGRLTNKLRLYKAIIDNGFTLPDTREIVEKYALPSVKQELALHKNPSPSEGWPYI